MIEVVRRYTIYGLRLRGSKEVRYIGQTCKLLAVRFDTHLSCLGSNSRFNEPLCEWLRANKAAVEAFKIAYVDSLEEARAMEKAVIALCLRLEHNLFNQRGLPWQVVAERRQARKARS